MRSRVAGDKRSLAVMVVVGQYRLDEVDGNVRRAQAQVGAAHSIGCWGRRGVAYTEDAGPEMVTARATAAGR
jgi:hypothetical protein